MISHAFDPVGDIKKFHEKFGLAYDGPPRDLPDELLEFRIRFMQEELEEYIDNDDREKKLDALVDLAYVLLGTAYQHGFTKFEEAWRRVHEANMKKVRADKISMKTGSRDPQFDVVKPPGWTIKKFCQEN